MKNNGYRRFTEKMLKKIGFKEIASRLLSKEKYMDTFQAARYKTYLCL